MFELHQTLHNSGYCLWTILAIAVAVLFVVTAAAHVAMHKKREKTFRDDLEEKYGVRGAERS